MQMSAAAEAAASKKPLFLCSGAVLMRTPCCSRLFARAHSQIMIITQAANEKFLRAAKFCSESEENFQMKAGVCINQNAPPTKNSL